MVWTNATTSICIVLGRKCPYSFIPSPGSSAAVMDISWACRQLPTSSTHTSLFTCLGTFASTSGHAQGNPGNARYLTALAGKFQTMSLWIITLAWPSWQCWSIFCMLPQRVPMKLSQLPIAVTSSSIHLLSAPLNSLTQGLLLRKNKLRHLSSSLLLKFSWIWLNYQLPRVRSGSYL